MQVISFINKLELICSHTSIDIVCTQLNGHENLSIRLIILFNINPLFANCKVVRSIAT